MDGTQDQDSLRLSASQLAATQILIPCAVGWGLQIFLAGVSTTLAVPALRRPQGIPYARRLLAVAVLANLLTAATVYWEFTAYMVDQNRSTAVLNAYKIPDVIVPIPAAIASVATQSFMAIRCWRIIGRNKVFAVVVTAGIVSVLAGATWGTAYDVLYMQGRIDDTAILVPTLVWLWSNVFVDLLITLVLSVNLGRRKLASGKEAQHLLDALTRVAFETCAAPLTASLLSAVLYAATYNTDYLWNTVTATFPFIPSLYVLSFVYCLAASRQTLLQSSHNQPSKGDVIDGITIPPILGQKDGDIAIVPNLARKSDTCSSSWEAPDVWRTSQIMHSGWAGASKEDGAAARRRSRDIENGKS